jgi:hypothetical protein
MSASQPQPNFNAAISLEPLPPARAALAHAIECFDRARERLDEAQRALTAMEKLRAPVSGREAGELRAQMGRVCEITNWLNAGAESGRPSLTAALARAERWLSEVAGAASTAAARLSTVERDCAAAAAAARDAMLQRERAVWGGTMEPARPSPRILNRAMAAAHRREGRLRGLVLALRETSARAVRPQPWPRRRQSKPPSTQYVARRLKPRSRLRVEC